LRARSLPLFLISIVLVAIFTPDTFAIIRGTIYTLTSAELRAHSRYDAVRACFVAVSGLTLLFTIHLGVLTVKLGGLQHRLNPRD